MPSNYLVSFLLVLCAAAMLAAPMPPWIRWLISAAFFYAGVVYFADGIGWVADIAQKQLLVRWAWIVLSSVIIICITAWRLGGPKAWRAR